MNDSVHVLEAHRLTETTVDSIVDLGLDEATLEAIGQQYMQLGTDKSPTDIALALAVALTPDADVVKHLENQHQFRSASEVVLAASSLLTENDGFLFATIFILTFRGAISDAVSRLTKLGLKVDSVGLESNAEFTAARERVQKKTGKKR